MAVSIDKKLPTVEEVDAVCPLSPHLRVDERRAEISAIIRGEDPRLLMIVGPCSAWPSAGVERFAERLAGLQERVRERLHLVMRAYIQKPRSTVGWTGPLTQPDPLAPEDIEAGIYECRRMLNAIGGMLPLADEMLFTHNNGHFEKVFSYVAIGARSSEDAEHRYVASGLDCAVGLKNPTSGSIEGGVNSVLSAQHSHVYAHDGMQKRSSGNPYAHLVLRGGGGMSNYDPTSLAKALKAFKQHGDKIKHPAIIIDASHENSINGSGKDPTLQPLVVEQVLAGMRWQRPEYGPVRGFMVESFLKGGKQALPTDGDRSRIDRGGLSITDGCLSWEETERLLLDTADSLP
jgi:3-deoxy-7-phosphoheptulonate synthase